VSEVAPRDALAAFTRQVIEDHGEWDSPHSSRRCTGTVSG
jgi:hypothetical protein